MKYSRLTNKMIHIAGLFFVSNFLLCGCTNNTGSEGNTNSDTMTQITAGMEATPVSNTSEPDQSLLPKDAFIEVPSIKKLPYTWESARVGGGGFITGLVFHPDTKDVLYVRSDVAGPFRWDGVKEEWTALFDFLSNSDASLYSVDGIALDPSNPAVIYAAAGNYGGGVSDVLKSEDYGATWTKTGLDKKFYGNDGYDGPEAGSERVTGECIAVDPANSDIVYCGTRQDGLWRSADGAATWEQVREVPAGRTGAGIRCVIFGKDGGVTDGKSNNIYAGVVGEGVFMSNDGGETWSHMDGGPAEPKHMKSLSADKLLVVSGKTSWHLDKNDKVDEQDGLFAYDGKRNWSNISPVKNRMLGDVAVYPEDETILIVNDFFAKKLYRSKDGGNSWKVIGNSIQPEVPWWPANFFYSNIVCLEFDPCRPNRLWLTNGGGIWRCDDIMADVVRWHSEVSGIEETAVTDIAVPPLDISVVLAGFLDIDGFAFTDLTQYPKKSFGEPWLGDCVSIDYCWREPEIVFRSGGSWAGVEAGNAGYSIDGGLTWNKLLSKWVFSNGGQMAVASDTGDNGWPAVVFVPLNDVPKVSFDMGNTWTDSKGVPAELMKSFWEYPGNIIESDKNNPAVFYLLDKYTGDFYISNDSGLNFAQVYSFGYETKSWDYPVVKTWEGIPGLVFVTIPTKGLYYSMDNGATFHRYKAIKTIQNLGLGKGPKDVKWPSLYVKGVIYSTEGVFRSDDLGKTWLQIDNETHRMGIWMPAIEGDTRTHGIVYAATNGRGLMYGIPKE